MTSRLTSSRRLAAAGVAMAACAAISLNSAVNAAPPHFQGLGFASGYWSGLLSADGSVLFMNGARWTAATGLVAVTGITVRAISGDGTVAVGTGSDGLAALWTDADGVVSLGVPQHYENSEAISVSADGLVVVGNAWRLVACPGNPYPVVDNAGWRWVASSGTMQILPHLNGDHRSSATAGSADGVTAIGASLGSCNSGSGAGCLWAGTGNPIALEPPPGALSAIPRAVSADGGVVAGYFNVPDSVFAFRWTESDGLMSLGTLPGQTRSLATAISADGSVITGNCGNPFSVPFVAFVWDALHGMRELTLPDQTYTYVSGISADGSVVVGTCSRGSFTSVIPFLWDQQRGTRELQSVFIGLGLDLTDWMLLGGVSISADGRTLVGSGLHADGQDEIWMAYLGDGCGLPGDLDQDGAINLSDLAALLAHFGAQSGATSADGDIEPPNGDGDVDLNDLSTMLANFGSVCS